MIVITGNICQKNSFHTDGMVDGPWKVVIKLALLNVLQSFIFSLDLKWKELPRSNKLNRVLIPGPKLPSKNHDQGLL